MTYELISDRNMTSGLGVVFEYVNDITSGLFIRMLIGTVWIIIVMGLYYSQKKGSGVGDIPQSLAVAGFVIIVLSILLRMASLIDIWTLTAVIVIGTVSVLYFLFHED